MSEELVDMRVRAEHPDAPHHLPQQMVALKNVLNDQSKWSELQSPFDLPQVNIQTNVIDGWVQVVLGDAEIPLHGHKPVAIVRVEQSDADPT